MDGVFLSLYKPVGVSSAKVLNSVKNTFETKKVGHLGTLDPLAEGILPVAVNEATKLIPYLDTEPKIYEFEIYFGFTTETLDREPIDDMSSLPFKEQSFSADELISCLNGFVGGYEQVPPIYSAVKINGKRSYELARKGEINESEIASRKVDLFKVELLSFEWPIARVEIEVGSGFYVRSFVRDLGDALAEDAFMLSLVRKRVGPFHFENSIAPEKVKKDSGVSFQELFDFDHLELDETEFKRIRSGLPIKSSKTFSTDFIFGLFNGKLCSVLKRKGKEVIVVKNLRQENE